MPPQIPGQNRYASFLMTSQLHTWCKKLTENENDNSTFGQLLKLTGSTSIDPVEANTILAKYYILWFQLLINNLS